LGILFGAADIAFGVDASLPRDVPTVSVGGDS
jgi:hypothetical protein